MNLRILLLAAALFTVSANARAADYEEYHPTLACDAARARCLLVIERFDVTLTPTFGHRTLHARFIDGAGTIGAEFPIVPGVSIYTTQPELAFDAANDRFLLVFAAESDLYGQLLDAADGSPVGSAFLISNAPTLQDGHHVAFEPVSQRYLVVWHDEREWPDGRNVYGQVVNADGTLHGTPSDLNFAVSDVVGSGQWEPSVGVDPASGRFLTVWQDDRSAGGEYDIYGQLVNVDGTLYGTASDLNFAVSSVVGSDQMYPSVAFDDANSRFLVVWHDERNINSGSAGSDLYGQLVDATGSLPGSPSDVNLPISSASLNQTDPFLAYGSASGFHTVWDDARNMFPPASNWNDVLGQSVDENGVPSGGIVGVATTGLFETRPVSAYEASSQRFVVAYEVEDFANTLQGIGVDGTVLPLPEPSAGALVLAVLAALTAGSSNRDPTAAGGGQAPRTRRRDRRRGDGRSSARCGVPWPSER